MLTEVIIATVLTFLQRMQRAVNDNQVLDKNRGHVPDNIAESVDALKAATIARKGVNSDG